MLNMPARCRHKCNNSFPREETAQSADIQLDILTFWTTASFKMSKTIKGLMRWEPNFSNDHWHNPKKCPKNATWKYHSHHYRSWRHLVWGRELLCRLVLPSSSFSTTKNPSAFLLPLSLHHPSTHLHHNIFFHNFFLALKKIFNYWCCHPPPP